MSLKSQAKYLLRQFPFIYTRQVIHSCEEWIINQRKKRGAYFNHRGPWFQTVFPENFITNKNPQTLGIPNDNAFCNNRSYYTAKATLFYLQNCFLLGHKGLVLTADHKVFQEFSHHFKVSSLNKFLRKNPFYLFTKKAKKVSGCGAVLVSPESHNYYHWLSDVLPRIKLYEPVLDQIDHFCISSNVPAKFLQVLPDLGIPQRKMLFIEEKEKLHFDYLFVASLPGSEGRSPQWSVSYLRDKLIKTHGTESPERKLYFKRGDNAGRNVLNEDAIINILQREGFDIIDPGNLNIHEQINLMQHAKIVISPHGAALSNLLFSRENSTIIELFSPDYFRTDCYYNLSSILNLNYWYIVGDKPSGANWGDIVINEELLLKTIQQKNG